MKFPNQANLKHFLGLSVAGASIICYRKWSSQASADTITWQQSTDAWSEGMMH